MKHNQTTIAYKVKRLSTFNVKVYCMVADLCHGIFRVFRGEMAPTRQAKRRQMYFCRSSDYFASGAHYTYPKCLLRTMATGETFILLQCKTVGR